MRLDLSTRAGALRFAELRRGEMTRRYLTHGSLETNPLIYVFATCNARIDHTTSPPSMKTGAKLPHVMAVPCKIPDSIREIVDPRKVTQLAGAVVAKMAAATKAVGVLVTMDTWYAAEEKAPEDYHYGWVEENQDGEGLYMSLEHRELTTAMCWFSVIHRNPLRLDPWKGGPRQPGGARLANFIDWKS